MLYNRKWSAFPGLSLTAFMVAAAVVSSPTSGAEDVRPAGAEMTETGQRFIESLDEEQRERAVLTLDDSRRTNWHYVPKSERKGVQLREMNDQQRERARDLIEASLSDEGYRKAVLTMELEKIIDAFEENGAIRDPLRYYITFFGEPSEQGTWGLSIEGHHLSLNYTVKDGVLVGVTPSFIGTNPAKVTENRGVGPEVGTEPLAVEEALAFDLLESMTDEQRERAVVSDESPSDMREAETAQTDVSQPVGLPAADMTEAQKEILRELVLTYVSNVPREFSGPYIEQLNEAGFDEVHFAWFGAQEPGVGHSYRVQGPEFLILLYNTQHGADGHPANHIHGLWRTIGRDFGDAINE